MAPRNRPLFLVLIGWAMMMFSYSGMDGGFANPFAIIGLGLMIVGAGLTIRLLVKGEIKPQASKRTIVASFGLALVLALAGVFLAWQMTLA